MHKVEETPRKPLSGKAVFLMFLAFFAVFASVDAFFVMKALKTHTGVVTEQAYEKGLAYNETLAQAQYFVDQGVVSDIKYDDTAKHFEWNWKQEKASAQGALVLDSVTLTMMRPSGNKDDRTLTLTQENAQQYSVSLRDLKKGLWVGQVSAKFQGTDFTYHTEKEIVVE